MSTQSAVKVVTTHVLSEMKLKGEKISMLTSYDYSMARIVDQAGIDVILVGDSASNVMAGHETTLPITLDQMIYHAASVVRGVKRALVVVDMPFGSYQGNSKEALNSAIRIMKETAADAIKLEGGEEILESIQRILSAGIPVMGHLGLTPRASINSGPMPSAPKKKRKRKNWFTMPISWKKQVVLPSCWRRFRQLWQPESPKKSVSPSSASVPVAV